MNKKDLLKELEGLGIRADGRKIRNDKGQSRGSYIRHTSAPRADFGKKRDTYKVHTAQNNKRVFEQFIRAHTNQVTGDDLIRDANMIFPPHVNAYYKTVKSKNGTIYKSSVKRTNHPEYLRWQWFFAEYCEAQTTEEAIKWMTHICDWYFIDPKDIDLWTYDEWAWCYYSYIAGEYNRHNSSKVILYDDFIKGKYGQIVFDDKGDVIWERK